MRRLEKIKRNCYTLFFWCHLMKHFVHVRVVDRTSKERKIMCPFWPERCSTYLFVSLPFTFTILRLLLSFQKTENFFEMAIKACNFFSAYCATIQDKDHPYLFKVVEIHWKATKKKNNLGPGKDTYRRKCEMCRKTPHPAQQQRKHPFSIPWLSKSLSFHSKS